MNNVGIYCTGQVLEVCFKAKLFTNFLEVFN